MTRSPAVVLLSGGLDSTTCLAIAKSRGYDPLALTFRYGQRHDVEVTAARAIGRAFAVSKHVVVDIDLRLFGGSALTSNLPVPKSRSAEQIATGIPITYVPARNTIFLSFAVAWAEVSGAADIFIGVNALDYSGYPDCRPEYIEAYQRMADLATRAGVEHITRLKIHTPLIAMSKAEIIRTGLALGVDYSSTVTCYDPSGAHEACGACDACIIRRRGFLENSVPDPTHYRNLAKAV